MKIVLGLGNPGKQYERTRHNLGFMVVDRIAARHHIPVITARYRSLVGEWKLHTGPALLLKPQTFMNLSGDALAELRADISVGIEDLVAIYDDLDLPLGRIRIRRGGGSGGHHGVQSILNALKGQDFFRVRVGVGRPPPGADATEYLLGSFSKVEAVLLDPVLEKTAEAVESILEEGISRAMQRFNRPEVVSP